MRMLAMIAALAVSPLAVAGAVAEPVLITNARIETMGRAGVIENGSVLIDDGRIRAVGVDILAPANVRIIDAAGGVVTPGFIALDTGLGLEDVSSVSGSDDSSTTLSDLGAAFDVQYAVNPAAAAIPAARRGGVTLALATPDFGATEAEQGLLFAGQAALLALDGVAGSVRPGAAMVLGLDEAGAGRAGGSRASAIGRVRQQLDDARYYTRNRAAYDRGETRELSLSRTDLEAVSRLLATRQLLLVHVSRAADIRQVLRLARDYRLNVALVGAQEGWVVADEIAAARVPVIINPTDNLPRRFEMAAASDRNAALLHRAGVRIAIVGTDRTHRVHEMRYNAGIAVGRGGLAYDAALAALTSGPATLLGLGDRLGTLEPGKDADIVVWSGDPLQPASRPRAIFIGGREQSLASRGTALRDRYLPRAAPEPAQP